MKMHFLFVLLLLGSAHAQNAEQAFVLDISKPYVYIAFDHVGPRKPVEQGEGSQGLWLRIVNNCKVPIRVNTFKSDAGGQDIVVFDEIEPIVEGFTVYADGHAPAKKIKPRIPRGYSAELSFVSKVLPGQSLLFSVPRNHVSPEWFMRVKFTLDVSKPSVGIGPQTELDFFNEQIPVTQSSLIIDRDERVRASHKAEHTQSTTAP